MARRQRRGADDTEFQDPLSNYDGPEYADALERDLVEAKLSDLKIRPVTLMHRDVTVAEALAKMVELNIGCVMVTEGESGAEKLAGIFSERDIMDKVAPDYAAAADQPLHAYMSEAPVSVYETDSPAKALNVMATGGFRHVPVLDVDDRPVGILGPRRVTDFLRRHVDEAG